MTAEHLVGQPVDLASSRRAAPLAAALDASLTEVAAGPFSSALRWWVASKGDGIELHVTWALHVPARVLRATRVAAGTALLAVRLAVAVSGFRPVTTLLPGGRNRGVLSIVRCGTPSGPTRAERVLFDVLVRAGRTGPAVPVALAMPQLRSAVEAEGAWLRTVVDSADGERLRRLLPDDSADVVPPGSLLAILGSHGDLPHPTSWPGRACNVCSAPRPRSVSARCQGRRAGRTGRAGRASAQRRDRCGDRIDGAGVGAGQSFRRGHRLISRHVRPVRA
jgi:hypothetical protein